MDPCLCGSGKSAESCCRPCHEGKAPAATAEALMRSRYVAYALGLEPYLLTTWHATTRPTSLALDKEPKLRWLGLSIKRHELDGENRAIVEFIARYKIDGRAYRLHENSRFVREDGCWFYVDGDIKE
ncbi:YchJ family protein [Fluviibacter phosphoraccumulans]|uniref:YchJ family protein n=1 Tax=Fluviibacter phosphoraccumulans TaxID=1751046 RepID=UPI0024E1A422|nr:YchJ family metal-binding protein [Fluviibacter phosphoraccumulans]